MSVYKKEDPSFLKQSMQSIYNQTVPTNDFVLICDGPLTTDLNKVIKDMQKKFKTRLKVVRLKKNRGLGHALKTGVKKCKNELIAKMDSDDIAAKDRCEKELRVLRDHTELSLVGSHVAEFKKDVKNVTSIRAVPEQNNQIIDFAKRRNPFNHPTVMFRKSQVLAVGNYKDIRYCQDYFLWIDLLSNGCWCYNIQEPLVYMREDENTFKRRSGIKYFKIQKQLLQYMRKNDFLGFSSYYKSLSIRFCSAIAPNFIRQKMFNKFMRQEIR